MRASCASRPVRAIPWQALALVVLLCCLAPPTRAAPPVSVPSEMPLAGPPPEGDLLPPVPEQVRARAAMEMLLVVLCGLALIAYLLRRIGRSQAPPAATTPDTPFDRARRAVEDLDKPPPS